MEAVQDIISSLQRILSGNNTTNNALREWLQSSLDLKLASLVSVRQSTRCCVETEACYIPEAADEVGFPIPSGPVSARIQSLQRCSE